MGWSGTDLPNAVYLDFRVLYWGLLNQFAYCENNPNHLQEFIQMISSYGPLTSSLGIVQPYLFGPDSAIGNNYVTQAIQSDSEGFFPTLDPNEIYESLQGSPIRVPQSEMNGVLAIWDAMQPLRVPQDEYWNVRAKNIGANVLFLNGLLDPNTPISLVTQDYINTNVQAQFDKDKIVLNNAGHTVIGMCWLMSVFQFPDHFLLHIYIFRFGMELL